MSNFIMRPTGDKLIVKEIEKEVESSTSKLFTPDGASFAPVIFPAEVIDVGVKVAIASVGDTVFVNRQGCLMLDEISDESGYFMVSEDTILGIKNANA